MVFPNRRAPSNKFWEAGEVTLPNNSDWCMPAILPDGAERQTSSFTAIYTDDPLDLSREGYQKSFYAVLPSDGVTKALGRPGYQGVVTVEIVR